MTLYCANCMKEADWLGGDIGPCCLLPMEDDMARDPMEQAELERDIEESREPEEDFGDQIDRAMDDANYIKDSARRDFDMYRETLRKEDDAA